MSERESNNSDPTVEIHTDLCKGCVFCVDVCPEEVLSMSDMINARGYRFAVYAGERCTGCGVCFYNCPEPSAITVYKGTKKRAEVSRG